jgi:hypothetical protein
MHDIITLLMPRIWPLKNRGNSKKSRGRTIKIFLLGTIGGLFWAGIFAISWRVLYYFRDIEDIGDILAFKLLSMILIISFALLIFSSILTSLSKLYLSLDGDYLYAPGFDRLWHHLPDRFVFLCQHHHHHPGPSNQRIGRQYPFSNDRRHPDSGNAYEKHIYFPGYFIFRGHIFGHSPVETRTAG